MMKLLASLAVSSLLFFGIGSQPYGVAAAADLNSLLPILQSATESGQSSSNSPGVVAGLFDRDSFVVTAAGMRQAGETDPMQPDDTVFLGSTFKSVTSLLVARFVDRGQLLWDSTLSDVFPETPIHDGYRDVTIQQILSHRGGFGDDVEFILDDPFEGTPSEERRHFIPLIMAQPPQNPIGDFSYSNIGYTAAGAILERIAGKTFHEIVQMELVDPLNLTSLSFGPPATVAGHDDEGKPVSLAEQELPPAIGPAGLYSMNLADWAKVVRLNCEGSDYLSDESLSVLHSPIGGPVQDDLFYALGWGITTINDRTLLTHNGSNGYWLSSMLLDPESCRGLLISSNQENTGALAGELIGTNPEIIGWVTSVPEPDFRSAWLAGFGWFVLQRRRVRM